MLTAIAVILATLVVFSSSVTKAFTTKEDQK